MPKITSTVEQELEAIKDWKLENNKKALHDAGLLSRLIKNFLDIKQSPTLRSNFNVTFFWKF